MPQVLVIERDVATTVESINLGKDRVITRKIGAPAIIEWAREGKDSIIVAHSAAGWARELH
jgi:hypothetical protein